ncbi:enoyl-CoA hydratase/isomerase family protein [Bradymonas sediminis]|uniref:Enoyl-CoA hydratase/isomerase family protein n=1 Tax=Bradymonas sediminis TaxID=1548548 RepID=A0A2Z4FJM2_9DELT|nr:enoyl-CoA hydratase-related protein [Bradymonas sediminis]AWV88916.1 enoyl-CoA hydratase/isomerase family protein [Bradymonas sediminis]TDP71924.1 enoyl-CoA hydratase [Bradymonas sediminis]
MAENPIHVEINGDIATVRLNRPKKFNALDGPMFTELHDAMYRLGFDDAIRVVIVTGEGRAFCGGGDLAAIQSSDSERVDRGLWHLAGKFHEGIREIRAMGKPVIAAINGPAAGGGLSLALACDMRIMADNAFLKIGYIENALSIDGGGSFSLPRLIGLSRAIEIAFLDEKISAVRALELGLVSRIVPADELPKATLTLANRLAEMPTGALARAKRLLSASFDNSLSEQLDLERKAISEAVVTDEAREGMAAFLEKRRPKYR